MHALPFPHCFCADSLVMHTVIVSESYLAALIYNIENMCFLKKTNKIKTVCFEFKLTSGNRLSPHPSSFQFFSLTCRRQFFSGWCP